VVQVEVKGNVQTYFDANLAKLLEHQLAEHHAVTPIGPSRKAM
jgi:hypothetical protein